MINVNALTLTMIFAHVFLYDLSENALRCKLLVRNQPWIAFSEHMPVTAVGMYPILK